MGLFRKMHKRGTQNEYTIIKSKLHARDGHIHALIVGDDRPKAPFGHLMIEDVYTDQINDLMDMMRKDGYIIVDFNTTVAPLYNGVNSGELRYTTEIKYK